MVARLFAFAVAVMIWVEPVLAAPGKGKGRGPRNVPEIDLYSGAAAVMALACFALLLWEWHRRAVRL